MHIECKKRDLKFRARAAWQLRRQRGHVLQSAAAHLTIMLSARRIAVTTCGRPYVATGYSPLFCAA